MKANNETATVFQSIAADKILPQIRRTGNYSSHLQTSKTYAEALRELADSWDYEQAKLPKTEQNDPLSPELITKT